jgi:hypothetical protein
MEEAGIPADDLVGRIAADLFERRVDINDGIVGQGGVGNRHAVGDGADHPFAQAQRFLVGGASHQGADQQEGQRQHGGQHNRNRAADRQQGATPGGQRLVDRNADAEHERPDRRGAIAGDPFDTVIIDAGEDAVLGGRQIVAKQRQVGMKGAHAIRSTDIADEPIAVIAIQRQAPVAGKVDGFEQGLKILRVDRCDHHPGGLSIRSGEGAAHRYQTVGRGCAAAGPTEKPPLLGDADEQRLGVAGVGGDVGFAAQAMAGAAAGGIEEHIAVEVRDDDLAQMGRVGQSLPQGGGDVRFARHGSMIPQQFGDRGQGDVDGLDRTRRAVRDRAGDIVGRRPGLGESLIIAAEKGDDQGDGDSHDHADAEGSCGQDQLVRIDPVRAPRPDGDRDRGPRRCRRVRQPVKHFGHRSGSLRRPEPG